MENKTHKSKYIHIYMTPGKRCASGHLGKAVLPTVPLRVEGIHEEIWSGTSLLFSDQVQAKKMSVKTC